MADSERLARGLGLFSISLGLAEILAPRALAKMIGVRDHRVLPGLGVREIASGFALLAQPRQAQWAWSRVGGDVMDLALLGKELVPDNPNRDRVVAATAAVAAVSVLDVLCARKQAEEFPQTQGRRKPEDVDAWMAVTINRPPEELYDYWRNFENLPRFMTHLESVTELGDGRSRWRTKAPGVGSVEWDAEVTEDRLNELISWQSVKGSRVQTRGTVTFTPAPGGRGTMVRVRMNYDPPGGLLGKTVAKLSSE